MTWRTIKGFLFGASGMAQSEEVDDLVVEEPAPAQPILMVALVSGRIRIGHIETRRVKVKEGRKNETVEQLTFVERDGPPWPIEDTVLDTAYVWTGD